MSISRERCRPCGIDCLGVTPAEEAELLLFVAGWEIVNDGIARQLSRSFPFDGWRPALEFASRIGEQAEFEDHHPILTVAWGRVTVTWWAHVIRDLHRNDFVMACRTNHIFSDVRPRVQRSAD